MLAHVRSVPKPSCGGLRPLSPVRHATSASLPRGALMLEHVKQTPLSGQRGAVSQTRRSLPYDAFMLAHVRNAPKPDCNGPRALTPPRARASNVSADSCMHAHLRSTRDVRTVAPREQQNVRTPAVGGGSVRPKPARPSTFSIERVELVAQAEEALAPSASAWHEARPPGAAPADGSSTKISIGKPAAPKAEAALAPKAEAALALKAVADPPLSGSGELLNDGEMRAFVTSELPRALQLRAWELRYSTDRHGFSLRDAYRRLAGSGPTVIAVLDTEGRCFGGFASHTWAVQRGYFGTGESFLFSAHPEPAAFHWTSENAHFQLAMPDALAMGGGGHFGLWLDSAFEFGSSGRCETYANPPLAAVPPGESFRIVRVDIWALV